MSKHSELEREIVQAHRLLLTHLDKVAVLYRDHNVDVGDLINCVRSWCSDSVEYPHEQVEIIRGLPSSQAP